MKLKRRLLEPALNWLLKDIHLRELKVGNRSVTLGTYIDIDQIASPAAPGAGITRLFMDSADGKLKGRRGTGTAEDILPATGLRLGIPISFYNWIVLQSGGSATLRGIIADVVTDTYSGAVYQTGISNNLPGFFNLSPETELWFRIESVTAVRAIFMVGLSASGFTPAFKHFGFRVVNATLYGTSADGATQSDYSLGTIAALTWYRIRMKRVATGIQYWLDGVDKGVKTTNLPTGDSAGICTMGLGTDADVIKGMTLVAGVIWLSP